MGSVVKNGKSYRLFYSIDGKRKAITFKGINKRAADSIDRCIDDLIITKVSGKVMESATAQWISVLDESTREKLDDWGLLPTRRITKEEPDRVGELVDTFVAAGLTNSGIKASENTISKWATTARYLKEVFGEHTGIEKITPAEAKKFRAWFDERGSSENTARKHIQIAKMFFNAAIDQEQILKNPFRKLASTSVDNDDRKYFVTREEYLKVLDKCPDQQWRLVLALCRIGGLRCPSEVVLLKWEDVLWDQRRIVIHSKKTEHHVGKGVRVIPMWPELDAELSAAFEIAEEGEEFVISRYRRSESNLRTTFTKIVKRAGLVPWPKIFQNLRASRETELLDEGLVAAHVVAKWLGHSIKIQNSNYATVADHHFDAALAENPASEEVCKSSAVNAL